MVNKMILGLVFVLVLQYSLLITIPLVPLNKSAEVKIHLTYMQQVTYTDLKQTTDSIPTEFLVFFLSIPVS
jgi:hypothetical protein